MDLVEGRLNVADAGTAIRICALIAQAELGDATGMPSQTESYVHSLPFDLHCEQRGLFGMSKDEWIMRTLQHHMDLKVALSFQS